MFEKQRQSTRSIIATKFIRIIHNTPVSVVVQGDDRKLYLIQLADNGQQPGDSAYAWISKSLAQAVGLPVTTQHRVVVRPELLAKGLRSSVQATERFDLPHHGIYLADHIIGMESGPQRPFSYLPQTDVKHVTNRSDFLGMYLFDLWGERKTTRKVFFQRTGRTPEIRATFLNDAKMFGNPSCHPRGGQSCLCDQNISLYTGLWSTKSARGWLQRFATITPAKVELAVASLPDLWPLSNPDTFRARLMDRLQNLPKLIEEHPFLGAPPIRELEAQMIFSGGFVSPYLNRD